MRSRLPTPQKRCGEDVVTSRELAPLVAYWYVPFRLPCVVERWAKHRSLAETVAMAELLQRAHELGGEVLGGEVMWLPDDRFAELRISDA